MTISNSSYLGCIQIRLLVGLGNGENCCCLNGNCCRSPKCNLPHQMWAGCGRRKNFSSILLLPNGTQRSGGSITLTRTKGQAIENARSFRPPQSIGADLSRISGVPCEHLSTILVRIVTHSLRVHINLSAIEAIADGCVPARQLRRRCH